MQIRPLAAAAAAVLALSSPALAQEDDDDAPLGPPRGAWSLSFTAPGDDGRTDLGAWKMVDDRTNVGVTLGFGRSSREREDENPGASFKETATDLELGLAARLYLTQRYGAAPFVQGRLFGSMSTVDREGQDYESTVEARGLGGQLAVGAEWFPVRQFSISGHTGVSVVASRLENDAPAPSGDPVDTLTTINTFTSALSLQIYF